MSEVLLTAKVLSVGYGKKVVVSGLEIEVRSGEILTIIGPNGAGKSTTISMLCGQLSKDSGNIKICGIDTDFGFEKISSKIGVVFHSY